MKGNTSTPSHKERDRLFFLKKFAVSGKSRKFKKKVEAAKTKTINFKKYGNSTIKGKEKYNPVMKTRPSAINNK